ncbi:uncharacterized protein LOC110463728 [Mizuhopecten yessoensis]|uniref:uncharacterized protein LOC110463728 n=1 Tax=Mizuhopecten yessoensis TaxID=6573 RepID=UPI000B4585C5|nr:uncharacterized protein LOC110463728 [Mizuhopecten yessoensis]
MNSYIAIALVLCVAVAQVHSQAAVGNTPPSGAGMIDLMNMMKNRGGKGMPMGMPMGMPPMGMSMGMPGQNSLFSARPKMGGALPFIMKMRMLDAMGIENPLLMMNMLGGGMGGLGAMSGMGPTPRGIGGMMSGMPSGMPSSMPAGMQGSGPMPLMGGAKNGGGNNFMNKMLQMRMLASMDLL